MKIGAKHCETFLLLTRCFLFIVLKELLDDFKFVKLLLLKLIKLTTLERTQESFSLYKVNPLV